MYFFTPESVTDEALAVAASSPVRGKANAARVLAAEPSWAVRLRAGREVMRVMNTTPGSNYSGAMYIALDHARRSFVHEAR